MQQPQSNKFLIKQQFRNINKYIQIGESTHTYELLYKDWLRQIHQFYQGPYKTKILKKSFIPDPNKYKNIDGFALKFKQLTQPLSYQIFAILRRHILFIEQIMKQASSQNLRKQTQKVINIAKNLQQTQYKLQNAYKQLQVVEKDVSFQPTDNIQFYFTQNWINRQKILQKYVNTNRTVENIKQDKNKIYQQSQKLQTQLLQYRSIIINYKYGYLKQGIKSGRKILDCLAQFVTMGSQFFQRINTKLKQYLEYSQQQKMNPSNYFQTNSNLNEIDVFQQFYAGKAQFYKQALTNFQHMFPQVNYIIDSNKLFQSFKTLYVGNQKNISYLIDVYQLFQKVALNRKMISQKARNIIQKLKTDWKMKRKTAQILNSLHKIKQSQIQKSNFENQNFLRTSNLKQYRQRKSQNLIKQFGLQNIQKNITQLMDTAINTFHQLSKNCQSLSNKITKNIQNQNDLNLSYQAQQIKIINKLPNANQQWLWNDWRQLKQLQIVNPKYQQKIICKQLGKIKTLLQQDDLYLQIRCYIQGKYNGRGFLQLYPQKILIKNNWKKQAQILIPINQLDITQLDKNFVVNKMKLKTNSNAQINIKSLLNLQQFSLKLKQLITNKQNNQQIDVTSSTLNTKIDISSDQLQAIEKRKQQIQKQRQNMKDYVKYGETSIKNTNIKQIYDNIFSQKGYSALSKNSSFFTYVGTKSGNSNYKQTKYNKTGPYYYTQQNKQITFKNCPIYSQKITQFDHPLPTIPFIPNHAHCKSQQTIYWINNKQLQYKAYTYSYGADLFESFYTATLYKIKQQNNNNVNISIWGKIVFIKQTRMKSVLQNGGVNQFKTIIPDIIANIQKCMRIVAKQRKIKQNCNIINAQQNIQAQDDNNLVDFGEKSNQESFSFTNLFCFKKCW